MSDSNVPHQALQNHLRLFDGDKPPSWREPQLGALAAVLSHWTLEDKEPALLSMPTGTGKTAVALALRYMARARRTLVVVPGKDLRKQIAGEFESEEVLRRIGALTGDSRPSVAEHSGRTADWSQLASHDVIVAIPSSISPALQDGDLAPRDFFDLIIFDEAHHAPAKTWKSILDHFSPAKAVLLTATPRRRDGRRVPGRHLFHYPLRLAMKHSIYKPIAPEVLELGAMEGADARDARIIERVVHLSSEPEHTTSAVLVRVSSIDRAIDLARKYAAAGLDCEPLHNRLSSTKRDALVAGWRLGVPKALAVVDMLGEGIDLPNLRIVGYHDKHKSTNSTVQLFGRLARANAEYPQGSVLITARDHDAYPALRGALRELYDEDADWANLLPNLIDADVDADRLRAAFAQQFDDAPPQLAVAALQPLARVSVFESKDQDFDPFGTNDEAEQASPNGFVIPELVPGKLLRGREIIYSGTDESRTLLLVVTAAPTQPRWYVADSLTQTQFDLHVVSWHPTPGGELPGLLLVNSDDAHIGKVIRLILDPGKHLRRGRPEAMQLAFESVERQSVSNVGVRETQRGGPGTTTYAMFAGQGVDHGLREADTHGRGLGHAMAQIGVDGSIVNIGFSAAKAKYWESRYLPLNSYQHFVNGFAKRYWAPEKTPAGVLLPDVVRSSITDSFRSRRALIADLNPDLRGEDWRLEDQTPFEQLTLEVEVGSSDHIGFVLIDEHSGEVIWRGVQDIDGAFSPVADQVPVRVRRGPMAEPFDIESLMEEHPPSVFMSDGTMVAGHLTYSAAGPGDLLPPIDFDTSWDWSKTDIQTESKVAERSDTIHDLVEDKLRAEFDGRDAWVLCNDGRGEIADHIVIERTSTGRIRLALWHSKASSGSNPGVRVKDMQVLASQALKSRRHLTDRAFWARIGRRLSGLESPKLELVCGDGDSLRSLCGLDPERSSERIDLYPPKVEGSIIAVQPGLDLKDLRARLDDPSNDLAPGQVREFLTALHNGVARIADLRVVGALNSPVADGNP